MTSPTPGMGLARGQAATLACLLEVTAPKVGNVHRGADFENLSFTDFLISAAAIGPAIEATPTLGIGRAVLAGIEATRALVFTNTNLGILLVLAPLAAIPDGEDWLSGTKAALRSLTFEDSQSVYSAIRLAQPGGMGKAESMDVTGEAPTNLLTAMAAAAERDLIARQYVEDFSLVVSTAARIVTACDSGCALTEAIVGAHVELIAEHGDSLIQRKCGAELAQRAQHFAQAVLRAGRPGEEDYYSAVADFDFWLRADGNRRNPGTTADLIAGAVFVGLRDGRLRPPFR